jgi:hypothetical protein
MSNLIFALFVFVIAFPFGFWRAKNKFKSRNWIVAIHIPVIFIILLRIYNKTHFGIGFSFISLLYNVISFTLAQYIAGVISKKLL